MKKLVIVLGLISLLSHSAWAEEINRIVAVVNDEVITQQELNRETEVIKARLTRNQIALPPERELQKQVLTSMITQQLELQRAEAVNLSVSIPEVHQEIETIAKENNITAADLYTQAAQDGLSREAYVQAVKNEMTVHRLIQRYVASRIVVSDEDVTLYRHSVLAQADTNKQYHVMNILIATPDTNTATVKHAEEKAQHVLADLLANKITVQQAAFGYSNGDQALEGGDLGWRTLAELPTPFVAAVESLNPDEIYPQLIRASNGFHIIKLVDVRVDGHGLTDAEIKSLIFKRKLNEAMEQWVNGLLASAYIDNRLDS